MWIRGEASMSKGLFIIGTDTDVGKTFVTAQLMKKLIQEGISAGYYKAVLSGGFYDGDTLIPGDAKEVLEASGVDENYDKCVSYILEHPVSPHLAAKLEGIDIKLDKILEDYKAISEKYDYLCVEGSGGIICPIKMTDTEVILLEDIIKLLKIPTLLVARAGLGTINHTTLTVKYLEQKGIEVKGIILNEYESGNRIHEDNKVVIERLTGTKVIGVVPKGQTSDDLQIKIEKLLTLFK